MSVVIAKLKQYLTWAFIMSREENKVRVLKLMEQ